MQPAGSTGKAALIPQHEHELQVITWGQSFPVNDTKLSGYKKWFHESAEDQYGTIAQVRQLCSPLVWCAAPACTSRPPVACSAQIDHPHCPLLQYYGLPWLSYRNAVWIDAEYTGNLYPGGWRMLTNDFTHPNDSGHK